MEKDSLTAKVEGLKTQPNQVPPVLNSLSQANANAMNIEAGGKEKMTQIIKTLGSMTLGKEDIDILGNYLISMAQKITDQKEDKP